MGIENIDPNNYNEIDLECNYIDDDDTSFNGIIDTPRSGNQFVDEGYDDRPRAPVKTGIMLDFSDEDFPRKRIPTISADIVDNEIRIQKNNFVDINSDFEAKDINEIDMETSISEDDNLEYIYNKKENNHKKYDMNDNKIFFDDDDIINMQEAKQSKSFTSYEQVEDDYWKNLKKKYEKENKNGHNNHFHLVGDINKELSLFNNGKEADIFPASDTLFGDLPSGSASTTSGENSTLAQASTGASAVSAGEATGGSTSESFVHCADNDKKMQKLFDIIGFEVIQNSDGSYTALDVLDEENSEIIAKNLTELIKELKIYIDDCFIYPLQAVTNQKFSTYDEWVKWYSDPDIQTKYPKCKDDIDYCKLIVKYSR